MEAKEAMAAQATAEADAMAAMAAQATAESEAKEAMAAAETAKQEAADAKTAAAAAQSEATAAMAAAETANQEAADAMAAAETAKQEAKDAMAAAETANQEAADAKAKAEAAMEAQETAEAEAARYKEMYEEATKVPSVGTQVGAAGRADSWRIDSDQSVSPAVDKDSATSEMTSAMIKKGVSAAKLMRDDDGVSFTIMEGALARLTTADDAADDAAPSLTGWQGTALAKTAGGTMQSALVYTNINKSVTPFSSKHSYTVTSAGTSATTGPNTHVHASATDADLVITGPKAADYISIDHAVSSANTTQGTTESGVTTIRGSYDGVPGVYSCTGNGCVFTWKSTGVEVNVQGVLLFQADDISTLIPDPDHQTFGVWMIAQDGPVTGNSGLIRPIAMANAKTFTQADMAGATGTADPLKGSATYTGKATGYYATRNAGSFEAESGRFTATATLKANFDAAATPVPTSVAAPTATNGQPIPLTAARVAQTATGTETAYYRVTVPSPGVSFAGSMIHDFMAEDGTAMAGWVVNLNGGSLRRPADIAVSAQTGENADARRTAAGNAALAAARAASMFEGMTSGTSGAMEWSGHWDATLHGTTKANLPTSVVGTFQADAGMSVPALVEGAINQTIDTGFAGVIGSFGATR